LSTNFDYQLFMPSKEESHFNCRTKFYESDGRLVPYEIMCSNRQIFCNGLVLSEYSKEIERRLEYEEAAAEIFGGKPVSSRGYVPAPLSKSELLDQSRRRAKRKIFDYCICNEFELFVTLTLDRAQIDRNDYKTVIKRLNTWLGNRVRRNGLKYIGVPEYHKNGGLHFHFAMSGGGFRLVDSGTVSVDGRKKPIKVATADRLGIPLSERHTVYNIADWKLGFSTAIMTYGERGALATYLSKELCKDVQKAVAQNCCIDKIGGRWYYHGGDLKKPRIELQNRNFDQLEGFTYSADTEGGKIKVYKLTEQGEILKR
jgi:hypothetical protein